VGFPCVYLDGGSCFDTGNYPPTTIVVNQNFQELLGASPQIVALGAPLAEVFQTFHVAGNQGFLFCACSALELPFS
jgi:hypothetical protein